MSQAPIVDKAALARVGETVRKRLAGDPAVFKVPVDKAEVFTLGGFLDAAECAHLMGVIDAVARPSTTFDPENRERYRTSYSGDVDPDDSFVRMVERRIGDLIGIDGRWGETIQGQRYEPGQEFKQHYDWFDTGADYWTGETARGGQRSWTVMAYLNDMPDGGATTFPRIGLTVQPQAGALLIWNNALPDGRPNPDVLHAAEPVKEGVKYIITKWFRTRPWS